MVVGVPREIKSEEYRVGIIPEVVAQLSHSGITVLVEKEAGSGAGCQNEDYQEAGAKIVEKAEEVYGNADLIVKVKEPQESEWPWLREGQILFTFFHFSANRLMTEELLKRRVTCVAYELVEENGILPILRPMSEIAGKLSIQQGMKYLEKEYGGKGILLSGVAGVKKGKVVIIGGGAVGFNAARIALGIGAEVVILEINQERMRFLEDNLPGAQILYSNSKNLTNAISDADVLIGAVLIPGRRTPVLLKRRDLLLMEKGTVLIDVSIDEGGVFETSRPTTHQSPIFVEEGMVHYCVPNTPGVVPRTSTYALAYASFPYLRLLAEYGETAWEKSEALAKGLALYRGEIKNANVAAGLKG
ncbi:MAG: alanine dehydrogenase [Candidatus Omnitrophica bacterium]|nr:alanine dehydrogenase [Candidatus Omnitrophota bacterium]